MRLPTAAELVRSVGRELGMRRGAYPKWVASGRMTQAEADREIACMDKIYEIVKALEAKGAVSIDPAESNIDPEVGLGYVKLARAAPSNG
jgi:hypothetical protein